MSETTQIRRSRAALRRSRMVDSARMLERSAMKADQRAAHYERQHRLDDAQRQRGLAAVARRSADRARREALR
jgi:hypothetical protein